jgi:uncharacterized protein (DUF2252 family)
MARAELPVDTDHEAIDGEMEIESTVPLVPAAPPVLSDRDHAALGRAERVRVSRRALGEFEPAEARQDPVAILESQETTRVPELVPIRHARMAMSPLAFYRGAAAIMAADLATGPRTALRVQLCGDAHLSNFGVYASPERNLVFDLNDFDETAPGPFEWDTKRLAASFVIAGRTLGWSHRTTERAAMYAMTSYRVEMAKYAQMSALDVWYSRITLEDLVPYFPRRQAGADRIARAASKKDNIGALDKLTEVVDGTRRFRTVEPLLVRLPDEGREELAGLFRAYRRTLAPERRVLVDRYRLVDVARKVVGVGSVGTRCWAAYLEGSHGGDPLFLQVKEATTSVIEPYVGRAAQRHHGQRVVIGQKLMQASSDQFLGWMTGPLGPQYYWRQLWDAKFSLDLETLTEGAVGIYGRVCGWALARAHARSGSATAITAYLGSKDRFERSMLEFSEAYADQNERDYQALLTAISSGRVEAASGI